MFILKEHLSVCLFFKMPTHATCLFIAKHFETSYCFKYDKKIIFFPFHFVFFLVLVARIHRYRLMRKILEIARLMLEQMIFRPINHRAKIFLLGNITTNRRQTVKKSDRQTDRQTDKQTEFNRFRQPQIDAIRHCSTQTQTN